MKTKRRTFLKRLPAAVGAGLAAPIAVSAAELQAQAPAAQPAGGVTAETLGVAQQIAGVSLPIEEREAARTLVVRNLANIEAIRNVKIAPEVEPAFSFRPTLSRPDGTGPVSRNDAAGATANRRGRAEDERPKKPAKIDLTPRPSNLQDLAFEPVWMLAERLRTKQVSSSELTAMYLERLKRHDPALSCVVTLTEDLARQQAADADREIKAGRYRGPLHGIPYGIKDLFSVKGYPTTWGAKPYAGQEFDYDATAVTRLREAGAVLLGKLATGELAVGDLWFRGRTRNPWKPETGSSGSSAGPASATSAGLVGFAVGTETNGSIMSPASTCGVVGLRPSYGRVSRYGCMTLRWTLDKVGAIARSVHDTALVLDAMRGPDEHDETVSSVPFAWDGQHNVRGLKIGYVERDFAGTAPATRVLAAALDVYRAAGAELVRVTLPDIPAAAIYALLNAEAGAMFDELVRSGGINELADKGVNGRANQLRASRFIPAVDYIRAQRARTILLQQMNELFGMIDTLLAPASSDAVVIGNLTGHPAITVPAGFVDGLPVGLMVVGPLYQEQRVLRVAAGFEAATDWHTKAPAGFA
ncbi:MAG TPA: amidase [Vicinamibacterales bacterium]|nr:amidase [Vicinamibacterales bacterium]